MPAKSRWIAAVIILVALAGIVMSAAAAAPQSEKQPAGRQAVFAAASENETALFKLINAERTRQGLPALTLDDRLGNAARLHSIDMAANKFFSHTGSNGSRFDQRLTAAGYSWITGAENIYAGSGKYQEPAECLKFWLNSSGHRANLLNPDFTQVGIGYTYDPASPMGSYYTADFGTPKQ